MKQKIITIGILASSMSILITGSVAAHVVVQPSEVLPGDYQTFVTSVPNEKHIPVTELRLKVPSTVTSVTPTVKPGWTITTIKSGDTVSEIQWSGGSIDAGLRDEFSFSAQAPAKPGQIIWKAYQTYQDGTTVAWDEQPADDHHEREDESKGPYSTTTVAEHTEAETQPVARMGLGLYLLAGVAVVLSAIAVTRSFRNRQ
jgi:uncharacterized protein YcnI